MAVRATVFATGHRFAEDIGPDGTRRYPMGSETEFTMRMAAQGYQCRHVPDAVVGHQIRRESLNPAWVFARAFRYGLGEQVKAMRLNGWSGATLFGRPRWMFRRAAEQAVLSVLPFRPAPARMLARWNLYRMLGALSAPPAARPAPAKPAARAAGGATAPLTLGLRETESGATWK
jgi:hypothetical protein